MCVHLSISKLFTNYLLFIIGTQQAQVQIPQLNKKIDGLFVTEFMLASADNVFCTFCRERLCFMRHIVCIKSSPYKLNDFLHD